jgi:hypothetical protein
VVALLASLLLTQVTPAVWPTAGHRGLRLQESMVVLEHGGPLLVGRYDGATGAYYSITRGDDEGEFVYVPVMSRLFGVADPLVMYRDLYIALLALTAAIYPTVLHRLTGSLLAGIVAPFIFLACMVSMGFLDMYWIPAWGALTLLPLVFLLARSWPRFGILAVAGLSLAGSWMSSIRSDCGLGIALAAAGLVVLRRWRWWRLAPALALVAVMYISVGTFAFAAIRAHRAHEIGSVAAKRISVTTAHALWSQAYEGIGYLPNRYGLRQVQATFERVAAREAPHAAWLSSSYEAVLRKAYFDFIFEHPIEAIRLYGAKAIVLTADTTPYLLFALLTIPAMLLCGSERRVVRRWLLLIIPAAIVAILPTMVALPMETYEQGLYGVIGAVDVVGLCWALARIETAVRRSGGVQPMLAGLRLSRSALAHGATPGWRSARVSAAAVSMLIAISIGGYFIRLSANRWEGRSGVLMELYPFRE